MRFPVAAISLFTLAVIVAACGGGGKSGMLPSTPGGPTGGGPVTGGATTRASMVFTIPAANRQGTRKPFYISAGTQSFGILAVLATSTESPTPENVQIFPVTTPSPCSANANGETCTFSVTAPIGTDIFYVAAFASPSPGANSIPLSEFVSGAVNVSLSPSPGASPLSFSLNGVVYKVAVAVPSPDPGNTPNTQVFTVGLASTPQTLGVTAYDSAGNVIAADATNLFANPIVVSVNPSNAGVGLLLSSSVCPSPAATSVPGGARRRNRPTQFSGGQPAVDITCAGDLNGVTFGYDGTIAADTNDHILDTTTINASQLASPAPAAANVVLQSNVLTYTLNPTTYLDGGYIQPISTGQLLYVLNTGSAGLAGTFTPSTGTSTTPVTMSGVSYPIALAVAPNGSVWSIDDYGTLDCWTSAGSVASGTAPATYAPATDPAGGKPDIAQITVDSANNAWVIFYDETSGQNYAGYFPATSGCTLPTLTTSNVVALTGDTYDQNGYVAPLSTGGIAFASSNNGLYIVTTANGGSSVSSTAPALASSSSGGVGVAANGTIYGAFYNYSAGTGDLESAPASGSPLTSVLNLVPNPGSAYNGADPIGMALFSVNGSADRIAYSDDDFYAMGLIGNVQTTPATMLVAVPNANRMFAVAYDSNGAPYELYEDNSENAILARVLPTTTWNIPVTSAYANCVPTALMSIDQRAPSSGPFTLTLAAGATASPLPGSYNDYEVAPPSPGPGLGTLTVKDAGGRTETFSNINVTINNGC